jgi:EpsI family protein
VIPRTAIVAALLIAGALYLTSATKSESVPLRQPLSQMPSQIGAWEEIKSTEFDLDTMKILGVDSYINRQYAGPGNAMAGLYIGYYESQRQGDTIHSPLNCLPGSGWNPILRDAIVIPIHSDSLNSQPKQIRINRIVVQKGLDKQVVLYWYQGHGRVVASEYWAKIYTVMDALKSNRTDAALVRVISPVKGSDKAAQEISGEQAVDFVKTLFPLLGHYLPN